MTKWQCNACGGTYSDTQRDGSRYMHACGPVIVEREVVDDTGKILKARVERVRHDARDENHTPGLIYDVEKGGYYTPDPEDPARHVLNPGPIPIISEGARRTRLVDE